MPTKKYTVAEDGPRIEKFLKHVFELAGFQLNFTVAEGETPHPDFENPEVMVKFSGPDVDLLLANKAEVLLALEHLTQEALAEKCGISARYVQSLEAGEYFPALPTLVGLRKALRASWEEIFDGCG